MRAFSAITAALLITFASPVVGHAASTEGATPAAKPAAPVCHCPQVHHRPVRHVRYHRHHRRYRRPIPIAMMPPPRVAPYYNAAIPSPEDTAYDRAMVLHLRSPAVSGMYVAEPGYPPTPPVRGVQSYRIRSGRRRPAI